MKKHIIFAAALSVISSFTNQAVAGPFGIDQGQSKQTLDIVNPNEQDHVYILRSVPKPYPLFESYAADVSDKLGVCRVNAASKIFKNDRYGTEARSKFDELAEQLNGVYGQGTDYQYLRSGALWDQPEDWVMAIYKNERNYAREWTSDNGSKMKDGISTISLRIDALSDDSSLIIIQYTFENDKACEDEQKSTAAGAL